MKKLLFLILISQLSFAFNIKGDLIIVHPSRTFDPLAVAQEGIEKVIRLAKDQGKKIYLLKHDDLSPDMFGQKKYKYSFGGWFSSDEGETFPSSIDSYYINDPSIEVISSEGGENQIQLSSNEFTIVGGYLEYCLTNAIASLVDNHKQTLRANIYLPGVYSHLKNERVGDDFDIREIWAYPTSPGFIRLERQVNTYAHCPSQYFVGNEMISYSGDYPALGNGELGLTNLDIQISCEDSFIDSDFIGERVAKTLKLNFFK